MKRILFFFLICVSNPLNAQSIRQSFSSKNSNTRLILESSTTKIGNGKKKTKLNRSPKKELDYVLYRNIVRRQTWLVGQGEPITQEVANHLPYYFR